MKEWKRDDRTVVARNDNYWFKAPNGDALPWLFLPTEMWP